MSSRKRREKRVQSVGVQLPAWRKLKKDRSKSLFQSLDQRDELFVCAFRIGQFFVVGDVTARLDREAELGIRFAAPGLKS